MPQGKTPRGSPSPRRQRTRASILDAAREVVRERGVRALTTEAVADRLGLSQPAVYYYFRSRDALIATLAVEDTAREHEALLAALDGATGGRDALGRFVRAFVDFHLGDLELFRVGYVWGQVVGLDPDEVDASINPGIVGVFDVVEAALEADRTLGHIAPDVPLRRVVAAAYSNALGLVTLLSVCDSAGQRFLHTPEDMVDTVIAGLVAGAYGG